jgi:hypothetical protein
VSDTELRTAIAKVPEVFIAMIAIWNMLVSYLAYLLHHEEAKCSSETSVAFQRNTRRCNS